LALIHCDFYSEALDLLHVDGCHSAAACAAQRGWPQLPDALSAARLSDDHTIWQRRTSIERYVRTLDLAL